MPLIHLGEMAKKGFQRVEAFGEKSMFNANVVFVFTAGLILLIIRLTSVDEIPIAE